MTRRDAAELSWWVAFIHAWWHIAASHAFSQGWIRIRGEWVHIVPRSGT